MQTTVGWWKWCENYHLWEIIHLQHMFYTRHQASKESNSLQFWSSFQFVDYTISQLVRRPKSPSSKTKAQQFPKRQGTVSPSQILHLFFVLQWVWFYENHQKVSLPLSLFFSTPELNELEIMKETTVAQAGWAPKSKSNHVLTFFFVYQIVYFIMSFVQKMLGNYRRSGSTSPQKSMHSSTVSLLL